MSKAISQFIYQMTKIKNGLILMKTVIQILSPLSETGKNKLSN